jgi:hypothetical protein
MQLVSVSDPLTLPTWLAAIFTGVLAVGAIVTAVFAILAFRKQSREVTLLQEQALHEQQDFRGEAEERRRSRAALVYVTGVFSREVRTDNDPPGLMRVPRDAAVSARVHNTGLQPVYDVRVHWVDAGQGSQAGEADVIGTVLPGEDLPASRVVPDGTLPGQFVPVAHFRDAAGVRWTLLPDGQLDEVDPALPAGASAIATTAVARARQQQN